MGAKIEIAEGTMSITPDHMDGDNPVDVWFEYTLTNVGDEDGSTTNYYFTVDDPNGDALHSDFVGDDTVAVGEMVKHSVRIEADRFHEKQNSYWVTLRTESGETIGAMALDVAVVVS